jgi:hypothetical protein
MRSDYLEYVGFSGVNAVSGEIVAISEIMGRI